VSDLKPGAIRLDVGPQRVCRGGSIAECDTKQDWREWVDVLTRILSRNVSRQSVRVSAADLTLDNGRVFIHASGSVIRQPALACSCQLGPGTPTFASFLAASFLPFVVYNDPTFNPASYDVNSELRTVVDVMEHTYDFSADTTSPAQYLRSRRKVIVWHGTEDTLMSHIDTIRSFETMANQAGPGSENARLYTLPGGSTEY
jgi:hypothetical protein